MSELDTSNRDLSLLAPKFRAAVQAALNDLEDLSHDGETLRSKINEGFRSQARQAWLFAQGRTRPGKIVTKAPTSLTSWHGYGLAIDFIHYKKAYWPRVPKEDNHPENIGWFTEAAGVFKRHGCKWGGDWTRPDRPHIQWGRCTASPTEGAQKLFLGEGVEAVWRRLDAT